MLASTVDDRPGCTQSLCVHLLLLATTLHFIQWKALALPLTPFHPAIAYHRNNREKMIRDVLVPISAAAVAVEPAQHHQRQEQQQSQQERQQDEAQRQEEQRLSKLFKGVPSLTPSLRNWIVAASCWQRRPPKSSTITSFTPNKPSKPSSPPSPLPPPPPLPPSKRPSSSRRRRRPCCFTTGKGRRHRENTMVERG